MSSLTEPTQRISSRSKCDDARLSLSPSWLLAHTLTLSALSLPSAPGGGVENIGLSQAVNDMLLQSSNGTMRLFPAWPPAEPAAFTTLRAKGAFLVSAAWDPVRRTATGVRVEATVASPRVALASPFPPSVKVVALRCSKTPQRLVDVDARGVLAWSMAAGEVCRIFYD